MSKGTGRKKKMQPRLPHTLPCGCRARMDAGYRQAIVLENGMRICLHGRKWQLAWQEVKNA